MTSVPGVFAAGDVADFPDARGGRASHGNWANAFLQGQIAGRNMAAAGRPEAYRRVTFYSIRNLGFVISFIGRVGAPEGVEAVSASDPAAPTYARFFLHGGRLIGAVLINRPQDQRSVSAAIRDGVLLGAAQRRLADPSFDIGSLLA